MVLPRFTTQTLVPSAAMAHGSSNPHPKTLTPVSEPVAADAESREALFTAAPTTDGTTKATRERSKVPTATMRQVKTDFALTDALSRGRSYTTEDLTRCKLGPERRAQLPPGQSHPKPTRLVAGRRGQIGKARALVSDEPVPATASHAVAWERPSVFEARRLSGTIGNGNAKNRMARGDAKKVGV